MRIWLTLVFSFFLTIIHAEPTNLSLLKQDLVLYHDSGTYQQELGAVIKQAQDYVIKQAQNNHHMAHPERLAIVLDIDETSLSNYQHLKQYDFQSNANQWKSYILKANAPAFPITLDLYKTARKEGVAVFFVTGRDTSLKEATEKNLRDQGFTQWEGLYLRPESYHSKSISSFKSEQRQLITRKGYTIIASIGDQYSDLLGCCAKKTFKLPNPYYFLP